MKKLKMPNIFDILFALIGVSLCGIGVGFVNCASLGFDSIGIFYDGIRNILGFSSDLLGVASFIVSGVLCVFLFFAARKYVSFGTFIYILAYGSFITVGSLIYNALIIESTMVVRIVFTVIGFLLLYFGIGIYVAIDIGVDAFTGVVLFLTDKTHFEMKYVKIVFDILLLVIGALLGGTLGVSTFVTMVLAGPVIQFFSKRFQKVYFRFKLRNIKAEKERSNTEEG